MHEALNREHKAQGADLSQEAVSKAVLKTTLQKPHVLYPAAVGFLGGAAALLLGPSLAFVVPAVVGAAVGLGGWALDYTLRRDQHASAYLKDLHEALAHRRAHVIRQLERDLRQVDSAQGLAQLHRLRDKYRAFEEMLRKKLQPTELTYVRYLGIAEQVFLSGLDNLNRMADTLKSAGAIDNAYVQGRIRELETTGEQSKVQLEELDALKSRIALKESQNRRVTAWLAQNERAMTQIDLTMAAIAAMDTAEPHAKTDMETAMKELHRLAQRAQAYSKGEG